MVDPSGTQADVAMDGDDSMMADAEMSSFPSWELVDAVSEDDEDDSSRAPALFRR